MAGERKRHMGEASVQKLPFVRDGPHLHVLVRLVSGAATEL